MSDGMSIRFEGLPPFISRMRGAGQVIVRHMATGVDRITTQGERLSKQNLESGSDTHHLQRSISMVPARFAGGSVRGAWGTNVPYAPPVEGGRAAGSAMPPPSALHGWLGRNGIPISAAFVVARAIGRRGIPAKRFMRRAFDEIKPLAQREFRAALTRAMREIGR